VDECEPLPRGQVRGLLRGVGQYRHGGRRWVSREVLQLDAVNQAGERVAFV